MSTPHVICHGICASAGFWRQWDAFWQNAPWILLWTAVVIVGFFIVVGLLALMCIHMTNNERKP